MDRTHCIFLQGVKIPEYSLKIEGGRLAPLNKRPFKAIIQRQQCRPGQVRRQSMLIIGRRIHPGHSRPDLW